VQGAIGQTGAQGAGGTAGMVSIWTSYTDYTFVGSSDDILRSDNNKARDIAAYLNRNPSAMVAIDGPNQRYVHSVVDALKEAGVPVSRMQTGPVGNAQLRQDRRVEVLVSAR
jgi:outer membrane protein OmpA-like peptidoglycan-associated protein